MIPNDENYDEELDEELEDAFDYEEEPSLTYAMQLDDEEGADLHFVGKVDGQEALKQAIIKIINTARYIYEIYSWDYGAELNDLPGEPTPYVMSEVKDRLTDAIEADDRVDHLEDFTIERTGKTKVFVSFTVVPSQGEAFNMETEVNTENV